MASVLSQRSSVTIAQYRRAGLNHAQISIWSGPLPEELKPRINDEERTFTHSDNPVTVVVTVKETSQLDWTNIRDKIVKLLEEAGFKYIAVEIGRGVMFNGADKNSRFLPDNAYTLEARPGSWHTNTPAVERSNVISLDI